MLGYLVVTGQLTDEDYFLFGVCLVGFVLIGLFLGLVELIHYFTKK